MQQGTLLLPLLLRRKEKSRFITRCRRQVLGPLSSVGAALQLPAVELEHISVGLLKHLCILMKCLASAHPHRGGLASPQTAHRCLAHHVDNAPCDPYGSWKRLPSHTTIMCVSVHATITNL